jgi:hypothetical protein
MTDFDIDVAPGVVFDDLVSFNEEQAEGKMNIEVVENKHILITQKDEEGEADGNATNDLVVKVKFFELEKNDEGVPSRMRVRFIRKRGDMNQWYTTFQEMKDSGMSEILLAPKLVAAQD